MEMTVNEIVAKYNRATEKKEQISILAQLNGCDEDKIRRILAENGVTDLPDLPKKRKRRSKEETAEPIECGNPAEDYLPGTITGGEGIIELQELKHYRTASELLEEPDDMTSEERDRLVRIRAIPELVKILVHKEIGRITAEIMERERQRDTLIDYLNGESENGRGNEGH